MGDYLRLTSVTTHVLTVHRLFCYHSSSSHRPPVPDTGTGRGPRTGCDILKDFRESLKCCCPSLRFLRSPIFTLSDFYADESSCPYYWIPTKLRLGYRSWRHSARVEKTEVGAVFSWHTGGHFGPRPDFQSAHSDVSGAGLVLQLDLSSMSCDKTCRVEKKKAPYLANQSIATH